MQILYNCSFMLTVVSQIFLQKKNIFSGKFCSKFSVIMFWQVNHFKTILSLSIFAVYFTQKSLFTVLSHEVFHEKVTVKPGLSIQFIVFTLISRCLLNLPPKTDTLHVVLIGHQIELEYGRHDIGFLIYLTRLNFIFGLMFFVFGLFLEMLN